MLFCFDLNLHFMPLEGHLPVFLTRLSVAFVNYCAPIDSWYRGSDPDPVFLQGEDPVPLHPDPQPCLNKQAWAELPWNGWQHWCPVARRRTRAPPRPSPPRPPTWPGSLLPNGLFRGQFWDVFLPQHFLVVPQRNGPQLSNR